MDKLPRRHPDVFPCADNITFQRCWSGWQRCLFCNEPIPSGTMCCSLHFVKDVRISRHNLWVHINCVKPLTHLLNRMVKKHMPQMVANALSRESVK